MNATDLVTSVKKHPVVLVCGLICLVCAGLLYYRSEEISDRQAEYATKSAEADTILSNVRNSANLATQVGEIQALSAELEGRLVRAGQLALNQQYFYKLESENEVKLVDIRQANQSSSRSPNTLYVGIPFSVGVQGNYTNVMAFLGHLETGRYFCRFNSISLSNSTSDGKSGTMSLSLSIDLLGTP